MPKTEPTRTTTITGAHNHSHCRRRRQQLQQQRLLPPLLSLSRLLCLLGSLSLNRSLSLYRSLSLGLFCLTVSPSHLSRYFFSSISFSCFFWFVPTDVSKNKTIDQFCFLILTWSMSKPFSFNPLQVISILYNLTIF